MPDRIYKPADPAADAARAKEISDAIRRSRASRGASNPPASAPPPPPPSAPSIIDRIKNLIVGERDSEGKPVGTGGRAREEAVMRAAEEAETGRMRRGQSTDHQNGY